MGKKAFNGLVRRDITDFLNPEISAVGSILEMKEISAIAEASYIKMGPHNCNSSTVSAFTSVHAARTMPNFYCMETFHWYWENGENIRKPDESGG